MNVTRTQTSGTPSTSNVLQPLRSAVDSGIDALEQQNPQERALLELLRGVSDFAVDALGQALASSATPAPSGSPAAPPVPSAPAPGPSSTPTPSSAPPSSSAPGTTAPAPQTTLSVPTRDLHRGDHSADVAQLQRALVKLGYLTQAQMNTGPGIYGPRTQAAVQKLQDAWHIRNGHGDFGPNTRQAIRDQLLGKKAPGAGSGAPTGGPGPSRGDPASYFLTQNKTGWNPGGSVNANCGPTSLAMAALAYGKLPPGTRRSNPEALIESVRRDMCGGVDNIHASTNVRQVMAGAQKLGLSTSHVGNVGDVDRALAKGQMVVALGNPGAYGKHPGGHFILVTGRAKDGNYVINDPVYTGRPGVELTASQLRNYLWEGAAVGA